MVKEDSCEGERSQPSFSTAMVWVLCHSGGIRGCGQSMQSLSVTQEILVYGAVFRRNHWHLLKYFSFFHCSPTPLLVKFISDLRTLLSSRSIASVLFAKLGGMPLVGLNYQVWYFVTAVSESAAVHIQIPAEWSGTWSGIVNHSEWQHRPCLLVVLWSELKSFSRRLSQWVQVLENETCSIAY